MAGFLSFSIRLAGITSTFATSSGALLHLYDPKIYAGDHSALHTFIEKARIAPADYLGDVTFSPWGSGLVVLDFDTKQQWDLQVARDLRFLSKNFDYSWQHLNEWRALGWLGEGLVNPETGMLVSKFPGNDVEDWYGAWYDGIQEEHREKFRNLSIDRFIRSSSSAPKVQISPPEWSFTSYEEAGKAEMLAKLKAAGFTFDEADLHAWHEWKA